jgi:hypothetical protein
MNVRVVVTCAASVALLTACGSSGGGDGKAPGSSGGGDGKARSHNDQIISAAQSSMHSEAAIHAALKDKLQLHEYAGVPDSFTVPVGLPDVHMGENGDECSIDEILVGKDEVSGSSGNDTLVSPDGSSAVVVGKFQGSDMSACLKAVRDALGW